MSNLSLLKVEKVLVGTVLGLVAFGSLAVSASDLKNVVSAGSKSIKNHAIHWGYEGVGEPKNWGHLKSEFIACGNGKVQSPIDVSSPINADIPDINVKYEDRPLRILNNGHTIQVNYDGGAMTVGEKKYNILQLHFHAASENSIDGKIYDMEMHFVHKRDDGALGVLGVMIEEGKKNDAMEKIWNKLPAKAGEEKLYNDIVINVANILPSSLRHYRFMGSLTTPPCSEGVNWHVLKEPIEMSSSQIKKFTSIYNGNARPIQKQNSRIILLDSNISE